MSSERLLGEVMFDPNYLDKYIAVKEVDDGNGFTFGRLLAFGDSPDDVHAQIRRDQQEDIGKARYFFYKPALGDGRREGWIIGGDQ